MYYRRPGLCTIKYILTERMLLKISGFQIIDRQSNWSQIAPHLSVNGGSEVRAYVSTSGLLCNSLSFAVHSIAL